MNKFEVYFSKASDYRWRLKGGNGEIVAVSEGYTTKQSARQGAETARRVALSAVVVEL